MLARAGVHLPMALPSDYKEVRSKEELITLIFELLDDNDAIEWKNDTAYTFLQAMAAWLEDADGFYKNANLKVDAKEPSWQLLADAMQAARGDDEWKTGGRLGRRKA
jgi:hypothetical protein